MKKEKLTLAILYGGREDFFKSCLDSLAKGEEVSEIEVAVAGNSFSPEIIGYMKSLLLRINFHVLSGESKSGLRNFLLENSEGEIVYFIDDDVILPENFVQTVKKKFKEYPDVASIGGPNLTPEDSSSFQKAQGRVLSSRWGASRMSRRYRTQDKDALAGESSFALCNLGFRKKILNKHKIVFDERLHYNEENDLLARLTSKGETHIFTPEISLSHRRREKFFSFLRQVFESGRGRAFSVRINKVNVGFVYFIPLFFLLYILLLPFLIKYITIFFVFPLAIHLIISFSVALYFVLKGDSLLLALIAFFLFPLSHLSYGVGLAAGLIGLNKKT
ncbi:MAG: glycosyltransferase [Elusimicrobia bacterium]|nr:glycosyltransferase [Elusimicrobiota bacterium]